MNILFEAVVFGHAEGAHIIIYEDNNKYYVKKEGHCVMTGDFDYTEVITSDEAIELAFEYEEFEDKDYLNEIC